MKSPIEEDLFKETIRSIELGKYTKYFAGILKLYTKSRFFLEKKTKHSSIKAVSANCHKKHMCTSVVIWSSG